MKTILLTTLLLGCMSVGMGQSLTGTTIVSFGEMSSGYNGSRIEKFESGKLEIGNYATVIKGKWAIKDTIATLNELVKSYKLLDSLYMKKSIDSEIEHNQSIRQYNKLVDDYNKFLDNFKTLNKAYTAQHNDFIKTLTNLKVKIK